jgi:2-polyprenyl-3-methyl-5-hydroxy-6-metoxy-1,4-benzoquinol methylase
MSGGAKPICLACGSKESTLWASARDEEYRTNDDEFRYFRCATCGVLFIDPVPLDRLSEIYPTNYYSFGAPKASLVTSIKERLDAKLFKKTLATLPGESLRVLDVGGGAGWQLNTVRATDARISHTHIVDLDPGAAHLAREHGHEYFCGRVEEFETNLKFDLILMLNLVEHVADPRGVLAKMRALLPAHGVLLVKTPNYDALDARIFKDASWAGYHCPRHWVLFTKESFEALAASEGLAVKRFSYTQGAPFWAASTLFWMGATVTRERPVFSHPLFGLLTAGFAALDFSRIAFSKTSQMFFTLGPAE